MTVDMLRQVIHSEKTAF